MTLISMAGMKGARRKIIHPATNRVELFFFNISFDLYPRMTVGASLARLDAVVIIGASSAKSRR
jgi:hypothetical protein